MSKAIEVCREGDTRRGTTVLEPATYDLCRNKEHVVIRRRCSIETVETFQRVAYAEPAWVVTGYHVDTLKVLPRWWERVFAALLFREQPIPRAVTIVSRKEAK